MLYCTLLFLFFLLGAALLGGLIGWALRRAGILKLQSEVEGQRKQYGTLRSQYDRSQENYQALNAQFQEVEQEKDRLRLDIGNWKTRQQRAEEEMAQQLDRNQVLQAELDAKVGEYESSIDTLNMDIVALRASMEQVEREKEQLGLNLEEERNALKKLNGEMLTWKAKCDQLTEELGTRDRENMDLLDQMEGVIEEVAGFEKERAEIASRLTATTEEKEAIIVDWTNRYGGLEHQLGVKEEEMSQLQGQLEEWGRRYATLEGEKNELSSQLLSGTEERNNLLAGWNGKQQELETRLGEKEEELSHLQGQLEEWSRRYADLEGEKNELAAQLHSGAEERNNLDGQLDGPL